MVFILTKRQLMQNLTRRRYDMVIIKYSSQQTQDTHPEQWLDKITESK